MNFSARAVDLVADAIDDVVQNATRHQFSHVNISIVELVVEVACLCQQVQVGRCPSWQC